MELSLRSCQKYFQSGTDEIIGALAKEIYLFMVQVELCPILTNISMINRLY